MSKITCQSGLTESQKKKLFWASFISLAATSYGFVFRVLDLLGGSFDNLGLQGQELGRLFGASLWPVAITMIIFSLAVDKIGYKNSMIIAFFFQLISIIGTICSNSFNSLYLASICAGFGHGIVEAVINPICSSIYTTQKSKMLNILHASWPAGIMIGTFIIILTSGLSWEWHIAFMAIPVIIYGYMFLSCKFPVDERVKANISYKKMLGEFGGLSFFLAGTLLFYEITNIANSLLESGNIFDIENRGLISLIFGAITGIGFGLWVKSKGKIIIFILAILMIPLATTELGTDGWIKALMEPILKNYDINASWAIGLSAAIMMILRFNAGFLLKKFSPPALLFISCLFSAIGLMILSQTTTSIVFLAFIFYAIGQTFLWPTMLGFISERYPKGGAVTLNSLTAIGLLSLGIIGAPFLGAIQDREIFLNVKEALPNKKIQTQKNDFLGIIEYDVININTIKKKSLTKKESTNLQISIDKAKRKALFAASIMPIFMSICFFIFILYYRSQGGYKPIILNKEN